MAFTTSGRQYFDDGVPVPSVTTILNEAWPKQLTKWAAETVAGFAVDHWDELAGLPVSDRLRELEKQVWVRRDAAALRGTDIHALGERLVAGLEVDVPDELVGPVEAYARFLDKWKVVPLAVERPILNRTAGYAGRPDLLASLTEDGMWLLDIKTGGKLYESHVLQVCAYANAEVYLDEHGHEKPWPKPDRCGFVLVSADDAELRPAWVDAGTYRTFRYVTESAKYARACTAAYKEHRAWPVGPAMRPPGERPRMEAVQ